MKSSKLLFFGLLFAAGGLSQLVGAIDGPPLASGLTKFLGSIDSSSQRVNFTAYFDQVTPENAGKWGSAEPSRDVMNWTELDAAYALAKTNGFPFKMHNLIWGNQQPAWISALSPAEQLDEIKEWFAAVAARYPDIDMIDVVNEPLHAPPDGASGRANYVAALGGTGASGWEWVLEAFRLARTYFPHSKLLLNEYNIVGSSSATQQYLDIIHLLQAENLIDGIGIQGHAFETVYYQAATMSANLNTIAEAGLPIYISEFDIDGATDEAQLAEYQRVFPVFWDNAAVRGVTLWGYRPGLWRNDQKAYIVLSDDTERPAMAWLKSYVRDGRVAVAALPQNQTAAVGGNLNLSVAASADPAPTLAWRRNGAVIDGATSTTLALADVQPASTGVYDVLATSGAQWSTSKPVILGVTTAAAAAGDGSVLNQTPILHPNGKYYDQVLLTGAAAAISPQGGRTTRTSFIDLNGDIVQVEFAGAGTLSLVLDDPSGPAAPVNYNQDSVSYMKGHVGLAIAGADETTNVLVFTVGRATAFDPTGHYNILAAPTTPGGGGANDPATNGSSLFVGHEATEYDGVADLSFIAISSTNGRFGGLRASDSRFWATNGLTGVYAPGIAFAGPVFIGDVDARGNATPVIVVGSTDDARITGGSLHQTNDAHVLVHGFQQLKFTAGGDSGGHAIAARANEAVLEEDGEDVTEKIVINAAN